MIKHMIQHAKKHPGVGWIACCLLSANYFKDINYYFFLVKLCSYESKENCKDFTIFKTT